MIFRFGLAVGALAVAASLFGGGRDDGVVALEPEAVTMPVPDTAIALLGEAWRIGPAEPVRTLPEDLPQSIALAISPRPVMRPGREIAEAQIPRPLPRPPSAATAAIQDIRQEAVPVESVASDWTIAGDIGNARWVVRRQDIGTVVAELPLDEALAMLEAQASAFVIAR